jgi:endonuclease YncB( thermonuclease family)
LVLWVSVLILSTGFFFPALAASRGFVNYDGDTLRATFRIANIDAPEIKGQCDDERRLAIKAREFTRVWLAKGRVTIKQTGVDRYGRILALVERNGEDLGKALIAARLARPWVGRRQPWC